jgi:hypothetical protein
MKKENVNCTKGVCMPNLKENYNLLQVYSLCFFSNYFQKREMLCFWRVALAVAQTYNYYLSLWQLWLVKIRSAIMCNFNR